MRTIRTISFALFAVAFCFFCSTIPAAPLHDAAYRGDVAKVKELLAGGADVNAKDDKSDTPLHYACFEGRVEVVELLLQKGAELDPVDKSGHTPFHAAVFRGHDALAKLL